MPTLRLILLPLLAAVFLLGAAAVPSQAQQELTPQEKKMLQQKEEQSDAEGVSVGDYTDQGYMWGTTLQIGVLLATLVLLAFGAWKIQSLSARVVARAREPADQRRWKRVRVESEAAEAYFADQTDTRIQGSASLRDISQGGACVVLSECPENLEPGHDLKLQIRIKDGAELTLSNLFGTVRWIQQNRVGIQFSDILHYSYDLLESLFHPSAQGRTSGAET